MDILIFKKAIESALLITNWSPTDSHLREIANRLAGFLGVPSKENVASIVLGVVENYEAMLLEGIDNSDLITLLNLAKKVSSEDDE